MTTQQPTPNPERIFSAVWAYQQTRALEAALRLNLFTAIGEGAATAEEAAKRIDASERQWEQPRSQSTLGSSTKAH